MVFTKRLRQGVRCGEITCSVRIWKNPRVKPGGRYPMEEGFIEVDSVEEISIQDITPELARAAGFLDVNDLLSIARHGSGNHVYLVRFHFVGLPKSRKIVEQKEAAKPGTPQIRIRRAELGSPVAARLIRALNAELHAAHPEPGANHFSLAGAEVAAGEGAFLVAYIGRAAAGCGAIRRSDATTGELKRMYVVPRFRRNGVGRALIEALESEARAIGVSRVVLETGTRLAAAIGMYEGMGYSRIPLFGEYLSSPDTSLCLGKTLA